MNRFPEHLLGSEKPRALESFCINANARIHAKISPGCNFAWITEWLDSFIYGFEIVGEFVIPPINADNFIFSFSFQIFRFSLALFRLERRMSMFIGAMSTHYLVGICIAGTNRVRRRGRGSESERRSVDYVFSDYKLLQPYLR